MHQRKPSSPRFPSPPKKELVRLALASELWCCEEQGAILRVPSSLLEHSWYCPWTILYNIAAFTPKPPIYLFELCLRIIAWVRWKERIYKFIHVNPPLLLSHGPYWYKSAIVCSSSQGLYLNIYVRKCVITDQGMMLNLFAFFCDSSPFQQYIHNLPEERWHS